ncbi:hypothetical protein [Amycolatopsis sp. NPDC004079]|uniref:hypothetical protein n=1 Tax=Amycolatopsis sp. NPDC004079 TaxID=3154549 RepID=UPI0033A8CAC6
MTDADQLTRLSDAMLAAFGPDGEYDDAVYAAAAAETFDTACGGQLLMAWARVLAVTHARTENPLQQPLQRLEGHLDHEARDLVRRNGRLLVNTARVADDIELAQCWLAIMDRLDDHALTWLSWTTAAATAPVLRPLGGLDRYAAALDVVQTAARNRHADAAFCDAGAVAAALAAVAAGAQDAAARYLALSDLRSTLSVLLALVPGLLRGRTTALVLDPDGTPHAVADPSDPDVQRINAVIAAAAAGDLASALATIRTLTGGPDDVRQLTWNLALSLGTRLGEVFSSHERERTT